MPADKGNIKNCGCVTLQLNIKNNELISSTVNKIKESCGCVIMCVNICLGKSSTCLAAQKLCHGHGARA